MPRPRHCSTRFSHLVNLLLLGGMVAYIVASLCGAPLRSATRVIAAPHSSKLFLPLLWRPREPIGMIIQPSELALSKLQYDQHVEPGRTAVRSLLSNAAEALVEQPCAAAVYTTAAGYDCLNRSAQNAYLLALTYRITGDPRYSQKAADFVRIWPSTLVSIDPGDDQSQLDWSRLVPALIWGADLLAGAPGWSDIDRDQLIGMLKQVALKQAKAAAQRNNNWADAGNLLWLSIVIYADLPNERAAAVASWKVKLDGVRQPDGQWLYGMLPDGSLAEEDRRGVDGLAYNQGALSIKTVFAELLRRQGDPSLYSYTTPRGVGLKNGWDFLAPHVLNASTGLCAWPYTADHCVGMANRSGWELAYAYWRSPTYLPVILEHRPYQWSNWSDPGYSTVLFANLKLNNS